MYIKAVITICLILFGTLLLQAQELKSFKSDNGKYGYKDQKGNVVIQPKYEGAYFFSEGLAVVMSIVNNAVVYGYVDETGKEVIPPQYVKAGSFSEGLANVTIWDRRNGKIVHKQLYINKKGQVEIETDYVGLSSFSEGLAAVYDGDLYGFIDKKGKLVISIQYKDVGKFSEGLAAIGEGTTFSKKWGFIDKTGKEVIPVQFGSGFLTPEFKEGKAKVKKDGREVYIDKTGREIK